MDAEYKLIVRVGEQHREDFETAVNDAIADGWHPFGGVSVAYAGRDDYIQRSLIKVPVLIFAQAVVRKDA